MSLFADPIDPISRAFYVSIPRDQVVLFQGCFDLTEGLGLVRTMNRDQAIVAVVTTADLVESCERFLVALGELFMKRGYRLEVLAERPDEAQAELWIGQCM